MWQVGQTVCHVSSYGYGPAKVAKVGKKWVTINIGMRFTHEGLAEFGCGSIYPSYEAYQEEVALQNTWTWFRTKVAEKWTPPAGVSVEMITQAFELLFKP